MDGMEKRKKKMMYGGMTRKKKMYGGAHKKMDRMNACAMGFSHGSTKT